jgi:dihydroorotate dehydrogenase electron transfer subunit
MPVVKKIDEAVTVKSNREVAPGFWKMTLVAPELAKRFKPGQFFQIRISPEGNSPLLRRPFAPSEITKDGFAFVYAVVGEGTDVMSKMKKGASAEVLGPLGNGYKLPRKGSRAILVGGGCGTPSLRFMGEVLESRGVEVYSVIGARSACTLLEKNALRKISSIIATATDDGSEGLRGNAVMAASVLLAEIPDGPAPHIFACGPHPMLKGLATLAAEKGLDCQVSLEERMACGFGACMGCAVALKADNEDGFVYKRVCHDGPVFDSRELVWQ